LDLASGVAATHLRSYCGSGCAQVGVAFLAARADYSRFVVQQSACYGHSRYAPMVSVRRWALSGASALSYGAVSLDHSEGVAIEHNDLNASEPLAPGGHGTGSVGVALLGSSGNLIEDNSVVAATNAIYAGCNGYISEPPAHPLTRTTCSPSAGNEIVGNRLSVLLIANTGVPEPGSAIALDSSTSHNTVAGNEALALPPGNFALWDYNSCGVNTWRDNVVGSTY
jgi:hypothetical protein